MIERKTVFSFLVVLLAIINIEDFSLGVERINFPKSLVLYSVAGIALGFLISQKQLWKQALKQHWLYFTGSFLAALIWTALNTPGNLQQVLFGDLNRMNGFLTYLSLLIIFVMSLQSFRQRDLDFLLKALVITAGIQTVVASYQVTQTPEVYVRNGLSAMRGTLGNPNFLSAFIALGAISATYYIVKKSSTFAVRFSATIYVLIVLATVYRSDSQQGLIVYASGAAVLLLHFLDEKFDSKAFNLAYMAALFLGLVTFIAGLFQVGPAARLVYQDSVGLRVQYWNAAIEMLKNQPFTGVGIDSYGNNFLLVRTIEQIELAGESTLNSNDAHNIFLQQGAVGGIFLLLAYIALVIFVFYRGWIAYKSSTQKLSVVILIALWTGYTAQSLLSINQIGLAIWGWLIAGSIVGLSMDLPNTFQQGKRLVAAASAVGLAVMIGLQYQPASTQIALRQIFTSNVTNMSELERNEVLLRLFEISESLDDPTLVTHVARALISINNQEQAEKVLTIHADRFSTNAEIHVQLADLLESQERFEEAREYREKSILLDPLNNELKEKLAAYPVG